MLKVLKRFMTPTKVFKAGDDLDPALLDGPISLDHWQAQGFVEKPAPAAASTKAAPVSPPAAIDAAAAPVSQTA